MRDRLEAASPSMSALLEELSRRRTHLDLVSRLHNQEEYQLAGFRHHSPKKRAGVVFGNSPSVTAQRRNEFLPVQSNMCMYESATPDNGRIQRGRRYDEIARTKNIPYPADVPPHRQSSATMTEKMGGLSELPRLARASLTHPPHSRT